MIKTVYLNLEDDVAKIAAKVKREKAADIVLVIPKKSYIFSDSINMRLLKKQVDLLGKQVSILTMDETGQMYAKEAGFPLKFLPKSGTTSRFSDIRRSSPAPAPVPASSAPPAPNIAQDQRRTERRQTLRRTIDKVVPESMAAATSKLMPPRLHKPVKPRADRSWRKALIGFVALALVIIVVLVLVVLPAADITVYAKSQTLARDIDLTLDTKVTTADASRLSLPATAVNQTSDASNTFQTVGKKEVGTQSQGRVAIYNLTGSPLNLRATTTVLSAGAKNYTFNADQNGINALPGPTQDQNATVADITAQGGGESYNLPAGTRLEITNQSFGSQPQRLYAKTVTQVVGGTSRFISQMTAEDTTKAQSELNKSVLDQIRADLKTRGLVLIDDAYTATASEFATDKPEGTETPTFNAKTKVQIQGLAYNQDDLIRILRERMSLSLSGNQELQDISLDAITIRVKNLDLAGGLLTLSVHYESKALPQIDAAGTRQQIVGKSKEEASEILLSNTDIERVDIGLSPAWQTSLPRLSGKIKLEVVK